MYHTVRNNTVFSQSKENMKEQEDDAIIFLVLYTTWYFISGFNFMVVINKTIPTANMQITSLWSKMYYVDYIYVTVAMLCWN